MNNYTILQEDVSESLSSVWSAFKTLLSTLKDLLFSIGKGMKLPEIGRTILIALRRIPLIGKLIPNQKTEEQEVKDTVDTITTGDVVTGTVNLLQKMVSTIWKYLPFTTNFKEDVILPIFDYNDRRSYLQSLYKIMVDNEVEPKYAKAFLVIVAAKIPIYQMLYVWKPLWAKGSTNLTVDDKIHPWTAGDPKTNPETGLNEMELRLQQKVQKFIQIKKMEIGELECKRKMAWSIIKESLAAVVTPILLQAFDFFKLAFGVSDSNFLHRYVDGPIKALLILYYYYFLITSFILVSLAIDNEEAFHPSEEKKKDPLDIL